MDKRPARVGISSCLLGEPLRYDGGHKRNPIVTDLLGGLVEWIPVCPEVEIGLPVPRDPIRLEGDPFDPRLVVITTREDITERMRTFSSERVQRLLDAGICGYVLQKDSPSCGLQRVRVYGETGIPQRVGRGLFAAALADAAPTLPIEEEIRLADASVRADFLERIFAYRELEDPQVPHDDVRAR